MTTSPGPYRPVPADLHLHVEAQAGEYLPVSRYRKRAAFHPDWAYLCTPAASCDAVVAGLLQGADDVPRGMWAAIIRVHCPDAQALFDEHQLGWDQFNEGRAPVGICNPIALAINEALGYQVIRLFPIADILEQIEDSLGLTSENIHFA